MKKMFWSWTLLLILAGGVLYVIAMANLDNDGVGGAYIILSLAVTSIGAYLYARIKDKREGRRFLRVKKKNFNDIH